MKLELLKQQPIIFKSIFGVLIAWLFLSESISYMDGLGVIIITIGIYLVQTSKRQTL